MKYIVCLLLCFSSFAFHSALVAGSGNCNDSNVTAFGISQKYLWIGTKNGLWRVQRSNDKCTRYTTANSQIPSNHVNCIAVQPDGNVWIGTRKGIFRFDNFTFFTLSSENSNLIDCNIRGIAVDGVRHVWIGSNRGLTLADGKKKYTHFDQSNSELPWDSICKVVSITSNRIWVQGINQGWIALNYNGSSLIPQDTQDGSYACILTSVLLVSSQEGNIVFAKNNSEKHLCNLNKKIHATACFIIQGDSADGNFKYLPADTSEKFTVIGLFNPNALSVELCRYFSLQSNKLVFKITRAKGSGAACY